MAALELRQHNPRRQNAEDGETEVDPNGHEVVRVALALHSPRHCLAQRLYTAQNTCVVRQIRDVGGVLANQPVQELLEGLTAELPEENERVRLSEAALEPVEYWRGGGIVELVLQNRGPDPGTNQDGDDADESRLRTGLDVDPLVVEERGDDEGAENAGEVGEEGAERARADGEVGGQPGAHEAVVEVADEEGGKEEQDPAADEEPAHGLELLAPGGSALGHNQRAVLAPHLVCGREAECDGEAKTHDYNEDNVGGRRDRACRLALGVETQIDGTANNRTSSFGRLPDGKVEGAVTRRGVANDDGCFSGPEETGADTAESTAEQHEPGIGADVVGVKTSTVQGVPNGTKGESVVQSNAVVDSTCKHTDNGKESVYQSVGGRNRIWLSSTTGTQATESIPHAWRCEGNTACYDDLEGNRAEEGLVLADSGSI